jgi:2-dehydropantoate 2-reductase
LLVTTKAGSAVPALTSVEHRLCTHPPCTVVLLCNGALAVADEWRERQRQRPHASATNIATDNTTLQPAVSKPQLLYGISTHGVYRETTGREQEDDDLHHIVHAGYGSTILEGSSELATLLDHSGLNCTLIPSRRRTDHDCHDDSIKWLLWKKLAVNCVINPLSAIHGCVNGDIVRLSGFHDHYYPALLSELANVYVQANKHSNSSSLPSLDVESVKDEFRKAVDEVVRHTARNRSSMLQDVAAGRSTEVDYLSGYVVRTGAALGVPTPINLELWSAVRSLSSQQ